MEINCKYNTDLLDKMIFSLLFIIIIVIILFIYFG